MRTSQSRKKLTVSEPVPKRNAPVLSAAKPVKEPVVKRSAAKVVQPGTGRSVGARGRGPVYEVPKPVKPKKLKK